jgi:succinate dehydrogenase / fumarate reductase, cytochrome b subunit
MSTAISPKGARQYSPTAGPSAWVSAYLGSTVGQKILVALTGAILVSFVVFHMIGNLKVFNGRDSFNAYAYFLKHGLGALIWVARAGLLVAFVLHLFLAVRLKMKAAAARPVGYYRMKAAQASPASTTMLWTGLVIGGFVVYHLAHFTFGWVHEVDNGRGGFTNYLALTDEQGRHDAYSMVIAGFSTWWIAAIYLVVQVLLFVHLSHGIASVLQTLGVVGKRFSPVAKLLAYATAGTILIGNYAIVIAVWAGVVK